MTLIEPDKVVIVREETKLKVHLAILSDKEGNHYWDFPGSMTDDQIMSAVRFANWAHAVGFNSGDADRLKRIKIAISED